MSKTCPYGTAQAEGRFMQIQTGCDERYQTRDGRSVRVLAVDSKSPRPVVALVPVLPDGTEAIFVFFSDGRFLGPGTEYGLDIIARPRRFRARRYFNVYLTKDGDGITLSGLHKTREYADAEANAGAVNRRIGCIGLGVLIEERAA